MSNPEEKTRRPRPRLVVPRVGADDVGLVVVVHAVDWNSGSGLWEVTLANGDTYEVPPALSQWAHKLHHEAERRFTTLPTAFAFRQTRGEMTARTLSQV